MKQKMRQLILMSILMLAILQCIPLALSEEENNWPQFQNNVEHTGFYAGELPDAFQLQWKSSGVGAVIDSAPVIAENMAFVISNSNSLKALNVTTGDVVWTTKTGTDQYGSWSSPAYDNGMVFASRGNDTICVYASNGTEKWKFTNPSGQTSCNAGPSIANGKVFCSDWQGSHYYCVDEYTGKLLWTFSVTGSAQGVPSYKDGKVFLTSGYATINVGQNTYEGQVYCVDAENGSKIWATPITDNVLCSASVGNYTIYVTSYDFYTDKTTALSALDINSGKILWEQNVPRTDSTPALAYGNVYVSPVYCVNASSGKILWSGDAGGWTNSMTIADGKAFAGKKTSSYGYDHIVEYNAYTGEVLWESTAGGACSIANGSIYTIGNDGEIYAYGQVSNPSIDLIVQNVSVANGNVYPYYPNEVNASIKNNGNMSAENVSVSFLVNGEQKDNLTTKIGSNMAKNVSFSWISDAPGDYNITVEAHSIGSVPESNDADNSMGINVTALAGDADLIPVSITPSAIFSNTSHQMKVIVKNQGTSMAGNFTVTVKEGTNELAAKTFEQLGPAQSAELNFTWESEASGDFGFTVFADTENSVSESNETNNQVTLPVTVKPETSIEAKSEIYWTQFQGGSDRNGVTEGYAPLDDSVKLKWSANDFGGNIDVCPIVVGDNVYVLASNGELYAYNKTEGKPIWHATLDAASILHSSIPAYGDGNLFVVTEGGNLYAYNASTGTLKWKVHVTDIGPESPVTYYDHRVYLAEGLEGGVDTKYYYCYDDLGNLLWKHATPNTSGFIWNGASVVGNYLIYSTHEGNLTCLDRKTGTLIDEVSLDSDVSNRISFAIPESGRFRSSVAYHDGSVYTTSELAQETGYVWKVGFDDTTGMFLNKGWRSDQMFSTSTPAIYNGKVYVGQGEHGYDGKMICLSDSDGKKVWEYHVDAGVKSSPAVSTYYGTPRIYFTTAKENGSLYCLNESGSPVWEYNPPDDGYILQGAALSQGKAYFGTDGGNLYCVEGDWNVFNDPDSDSGAYISLDELQTSVLHWKKGFPIDSNYKVSLKNIQSMTMYWKNNSPMKFDK